MKLGFLILILSGCSQLPLLHPNNRKTKLNFVGCIQYYYNLEDESSQLTLSYLGSSISMDEKGCFLFQIESTEIKGRYVRLNLTDGMNSLDERISLDLDKGKKGELINIGNITIFHLEKGVIKDINDAKKYLSLFSPVDEEDILFSLIFEKKNRSLVLDPSKMAEVFIVNYQTKIKPESLTKIKNGISIQERDNPESYMVFNNGKTLVLKNNSNYIVFIDPADQFKEFW